MRLRWGAGSSTLGFSCRCSVENTYVACRSRPPDSPGQIMCFLVLLFLTVQLRWHYTTDQIWSGGKE
jgi:hypothetical protein